MVENLNQFETILILRNDSTTAWSSSTYVLKKGEAGVEFLDTGKPKMKFGDGVHTWADLPYFGGEETQVFEAVLAAEETHEQAIARVVGTTIPVKGDIAIVKELIVTVSEEGKYEYTAYVYDGTSWKAMSGNYNAKNVYFDSNMMVTKEIGYITLSNGQGTIPSQGKNLEQVFEAMFVKESNPTKTDPSVSVTLTGAGSYEVGTVVTGVKYSASFEDGKYSYGPEPTGATVSKWEVSDTAGGSYSATSGDLADVEVKDGTNFTVTAKATHSAGETPLTNKGNPCTDTSKKIVAGTKSKTSSAITGYRSFFYGALLTSSAEAPLTSAIIRDNLVNGGAYDAAKTLTINGNIDGTAVKRIVVAVPSSSTRGGLTEVLLTSAMSTPVTDSYTKTESAVQVKGTTDTSAAVDYDIWVYEPASIDAGEVHQITLA